MKHNRQLKSLAIGEIMQATDIYMVNSSTVSELPANDVGKPRAVYHVPMFRPFDTWVKVSDQLPTQEDADSHGEVIAIWPSGESYVTSWKSVNGEYSHWRKITPPADLEPRIMVEVDGDEMEVEFPGNGDVRVGCTTVPASTMDSIEARRKK